MIASVVLLVASVLVLSLGAELLVRGAAAIALRFGLSSLFVGLTVVGFGTSSPELFASVTAALRGSGDIAIGNVVGSNIFNVAVVLGVSALLCPIPVQFRLVRREVLVVVAVTAGFFAVAFGDDRIQRWEGALLFAGIVAYIYRGWVEAQREANPAAALAEAHELEHELGLDRHRWLRHPLVDLVLVGLGLGMLIAGSVWLVDASTAIARTLGASDLVIGLTIVAAGTSAPELVTSIIAALRRHSDIAVGNVLGSCVFNLLGILGITCMIEPQRVASQVMWLDAPVMLATSLACLPILGRKARVARWEGALLVAAYAGYVFVLYGLSIAAMRAV